MSRLRFSPSIEESIVLTLFDLVNHLTRNGEKMASANGLTVQQYLTLLQIAGDPNFPKAKSAQRRDSEGVLASEMARARGVSRASVSAQVSSLVRKDLVRQVEEPDDRRRKMLFVTAAGDTALAAAEPARRAANQALFRSWSGDQLSGLQAILEDCLARLTEDRERRQAKVPAAFAAATGAAGAVPGSGGD